MNLPEGVCRHRIDLNSGDATGALEKAKHAGFLRKDNSAHVTEAIKGHNTAHGRLEAAEGNVRKFEGEKGVFADMARSEVNVREKDIVLTDAQLPEALQGHQQTE